MTITAVSKTASRDNTNQAAAYATASVAFVAGRLYLVGYVTHSDIAATAHTASGGGLTFTEIISATFSLIAAPSKRITVFRCMPTSNETVAVSLDQGAATTQHGFWTIDEFDGVDTSGTNGSGAIVQSLTNRSDSASSLLVDLAAFASGDNAGYGFFGRSENQNLTEGSGFTPLGEVTGDESPTTSVLSEWKLNDDTVDYSSATAGACAGIGIEVKAAVSVPKRPKRIYLNREAVQRW